MSGLTPESRQALPQASDSFWSEDKPISQRPVSTPGLYGLQAEEFLESDFRELVAPSPGPWPGSPSQATFLDTPALKPLEQHLDLTARLNSQVLPDLQSHPEPLQPSVNLGLQQTFQEADLHDPNMERRACVHPEPRQAHFWDLTGQCPGQQAVHAQSMWPQSALSPHADLSPEIVDDSWFCPGDLEPCTVPQTVLPLRCQSAGMLNHHCEHRFTPDETANQHTPNGNGMLGQSQLHAVPSAAGDHTDVPASETMPLHDAVPQNPFQGELWAVVLITVAVLHDLCPACCLPMGMAETLFQKHEHLNTHSWIACTVSCIIWSATCHSTLCGFVVSDHADQCA